MANSAKASNASDLTRSLTLGKDGFVYLGDDGVTRSYAGNREVIDFVKLSYEPDNVSALSSARVQEAATNERRLVPFARVEDVASAPTFLGDDDWLHHCRYH